MTKIRRTEAREVAGATAVGRDGAGRGHGSGAMEPPPVTVAVMPLWDRPRPVVCR